MSQTRSGFCIDQIFVFRARVCPAFSSLRAQLLLALAQDHIEGVAAAAVELARHRNSDTVEIQDLQLCLGESYFFSSCSRGSSSDQYRFPM